MGTFLSYWGRGPTLVCLRWRGGFAGPPCPTVLEVTMGLSLGRVLFSGKAAGTPETDQKDPCQSAQMRPGRGGQPTHREGGSPSRAASCQHQPARSRGVCLWAGCWAAPGGRSQASQGQVRGRPSWAGGPFRAGRMSGAREADRRCHPAVTSGLARGHGEPGTPPRPPPPPLPPRLGFSP